MEPCLFSSALPGRDAAHVARTALDAGLTAVEWGVGPGQAVESPHGAAAASLSNLGVEAAGICVQGGGASLTDPATLRPFAAAAAIAKEHGVTLLVETAPETIAPSTAEARALVDGFPPDEVGVLYDPGNMVIEGHVDPRLAIAELGPYLRHVHVKNIAWRREHGRWQWRHATLDEGLLDWGAIVAALREAGYSGRLCLDHLGGKPSLTTLRRELSVLARPT
jgi:sugar phosphate isomerase/epimerase